MSKSIIYTALTTDTDLVIGDVIPLGDIVRRFGCNLNKSGDVITVTGRGYYNVDVSVTATTAVAASDVTITVYDNGVPVPGMTATATVVAAGDFANLKVVGAVRTLWDCNTDQLTVVLSGADATISNMAVFVEKM